MSNVNAKVYFPQGAEKFVVGAGGRITVKPGGAINIPFLTPVKGAKAALVTGADASSNKVTFTAKAIGKAGNNITIAFVADDEAENVMVIVDGSNITVICKATAGTITTTATGVVAAITADVEASELVTAEGSGTSAVAEMEPTLLEGGKDTTPAQKGDVCFDATNIYIAIADVDITDTGANWKKVAHSNIS